MRPRIILTIFLVVCLLFLVFKHLSTTSSMNAVMVSKLEVPWDMSLLKNGNVIFTQRNGKLFEYSSLSGELTELKVNYRNLEVIGEGGLLGMAVDPEFDKNSLIYLYYTCLVDGELSNRVDSFVYDGESVVRKSVLVDGIPASEHHNGGRMVFGLDGKLYIATGDTTSSGLSQDINSLAGKILRVDPIMGVPADNPFVGSFVYSYGHRNIQGLTWDNDGNLWATEHGPDGEDELNLIQKGGNYGWPLTGDDLVDVGAISPFLSSGVNTWAPAGMTTKGSLVYFAGLAGRAIYRVDVSTKQIKELFLGKYGRLRDIEYDVERKGFWMLTSNRDGRNKNPDKDDDRLLFIEEKYFMLP